MHKYANLTKKKTGNIWLAYSQVMPLLLAFTYSLQFLMLCFEYYNRLTVYKMHDTCKSYKKAQFFTKSITVDEKIKVKSVDKYRVFREFLEQVFYVLYSILF